MGIAVPNDVVETINDLRSLAMPPVTLSRSVTVLGYWAAGDGGGGLFAWVLGITDSDDGGTIFATTITGAPAGRWRRIYSGPLDVRWFGAVGDSNGKHGSGTDDTAAFNAALAAAATTGGEVLVPIGLYRVTARLTVPPGVTIRGHASGFQGVGPMSAIVADHLDHALASVAPANGSFSGLVQIRNLRIIGVRKNCPNLITGVTKATPCAVTCVGHGLADKQVVFIRGAAGMIDLNTGWRVHVTDPDHFTIPTFDSHLQPAWTSGGTVTQAPLSGIYNLGRDFDVYDTISTQGTMFGVIFDQTEIGTLDNFTDAALFASVYIPNGGDITPGNKAGFTNVICGKNWQLNEAAWGIAHEGGQGFHVRGVNFNGNLAYPRGGSCRFGNVNQAQISGFDCESSGVVFSAKTLLDGNNSAGASQIGFDCGTFSTGANNIFIVEASANLECKRCEFASSATHYVQGGLTFSRFDLDETNLIGVDAYRFFDHFPMAGKIRAAFAAAPYHLDIQLAAPDVGKPADPTTQRDQPVGHFSAGTTAYNPLAAKGQPYGWIAPYATAPNLAGVPGQKPTWLPVAFVGYGIIEIFQTMPNLVGLWIADKQVKLNGSGNVSLLRECSGNRDPNYDLTGHGAIGFQAIDGTHNLPAAGTFDSTTKWLASGTFATPLAQPLTLFCIGGDDVSTATTAVYCDGIDDKNRITIKKNGPSSQFELSAGATLAKVSGVKAKKFNAFVGVLNGGSSSFYVNAKTPVTGTAGANGLHGITLGSDYNQATSQGGSTALFAVFDRALSNAECGTLLDVATNFYGITIGS